MAWTVRHAIGYRSRRLEIRRNWSLHIWARSWGLRLQRSHNRTRVRQLLLSRLFLLYTKKARSVVAHNGSSCRQLQRRALLELCAARCYVQRMGRRSRFVIAEKNEFFSEHFKPSIRVILRNEVFPTGSTSLCRKL